MQQIYLNPANIIQPIFVKNVFDIFQRKPIKLKSRKDRWRIIADEINLSNKGRLRLEWMIFYETAGNKNAYSTARHFNISAKTFYKWHKRFDNGKVKNLLNCSKAPNNKRQSSITLIEKSKIKDLRKRYIHYGKRKLKKIYKDEYDEEISTYKIQTVINQLNLYPDKKKINIYRKKLKNKNKKKRIQKLDIKEKHWFLFHIDTIVIYGNNLKRYILTAIDHHGKIAYGRMYKNKSSRSAKDFLYRLHYLIDADIINIQTDNGSEFYNEFEKALKDLKIKHYFSRPRTPKDNSIVERFNETLEYEWLHNSNFTPNIKRFNMNLTKWLEEYNFVRPHQTLGYQTPFEYYINTLKTNNQINKDLLPMYADRTNG